MTHSCHLGCSFTGDLLQCVWVPDLCLGRRQKNKNNETNPNQKPKQLGVVTHIYTLGLF